MNQRKDVWMNFIGSNKGVKLWTDSQCDKPCGLYRRHNPDLFNTMPFPQITFWLQSYINKVWPPTTCNGITMFKCDQNKIAGETWHRRDRLSREIRPIWLWTASIWLRGNFLWKYSYGRKQGVWSAATKPIIPTDVNVGFREESQRSWLSYSVETWRGKSRIKKRKEIPLSSEDGFLASYGIRV